MSLWYSLILPFHVRLDLPKSIPIYIQKDATLHRLFISVNCSTCLGWYLHPLSGAHKTVSTAYGIIHTVTATSRKGSNFSTIAAGSSNVVTNTRCCRYSCMRSWWWVGYHPKYVEQFPDINNLCKVSSCWIYIGMYLRCTDSWTLNFQTVFSFRIFNQNPACLSSITQGCNTFRPPRPPW